MNPPAIDSSAYPASKYREWLTGASASARVILPRVLDIVKPRSVVDVGCGVGAWLRTCEELGVSRIQGIDGPHISREMLQIPTTSMLAVDLHSEWPDVGRFDLALCLETGEHLNPEFSGTLVARLTSLAPAILFSAAIPHQGGDDHRNEQWPDYWVRRFEDRGFTCIDCLRPVIAHETSVEWWYRQNVFLAVHSETVRSSRLLSDLAERFGVPGRQVAWECYEARCKILETAADPDHQPLTRLMAAVGRRILGRLRIR